MTIDNALFVASLFTQTGFLGSNGKQHMAFAAGIDFGKTDNRGTLCYQFFQSIVVISKRIIMVQFFDAVTIKIGVEALVFSLQACLVGFQFLGGGFVHAFF